MVERIGISYANCYLVSGEGGSILIDSCNYKDGPRIFGRVKDKNVKLILLTHGHFDHASSAKYLAKRLSVPIAMCEKDLHLIGHGEESRLHGYTLLGRTMAIFSQPVLKKAKFSIFTPDILLRDGQELSNYGVNARVVALPGHTAGSVGVITDDGDFIVGDAMFNIIKRTPSRIFEDRETMLQSVEKIRRSGAKTIYCGHGKPFANN